MSKPTKRRRFKIYRDEVKERLTNHWDWDYMGYEATSVDHQPPSHASSDMDDVEEPPTRNLWFRIRSFFLKIS